MRSTYVVDISNDRANTRRPAPEFRACAGRSAHIPFGVGFSANRAFTYSFAQALIGLIRLDVRAEDITDCYTPADDIYDAVSAKRCRFVINAF